MGLPRPPAACERFSLPARPPRERGGGASRSARCLCPWRSPHGCFILSHGRWTRRTLSSRGTSSRSSTTSSGWGARAAPRGGGRGRRAVGGSRLTAGPSPFQALRRMAAGPMSMGKCGLPMMSVMFTEQARRPGANSFACRSLRARSNASAEAHARFRCPRSVRSVRQGSSIWVRYTKIQRYFLPEYNSLVRALPTRSPRSAPPRRCRLRRHRVLSARSIDSTAPARPAGSRSRRSASWSASTTTRTCG